MALAEAPQAAVEREGDGKTMSTTGLKHMAAERDLTDLVRKLKDGAGSNLISAILYGSAATEEFRPGHSDLNVLCIMRSLSREDLSRLHAASAWWAKKGHPAPLFLTLDELQQSADIFAIELLDMKAAHRLLEGEDVLPSLYVPTNLHRLQVERELRSNALRLRQLYIRYPSDVQKTLALMTSSISTFAALFRHALIALGEEPPPTKRGATDRLASVLGFDPSPFHAIFDIREGHKRGRDLDVQATFAAYLHRVSHVAEEMDRRLAAS